MRPDDGGLHADLNNPDDPVNAAAIERLEAALRDMDGILSSRRAGLLQFEEHLRQAWGGPLDLAELLLLWCRDVAMRFAGEYSNEALAKADTKFRVLLGLHMRAQRAMSEVLVLLRTGHADGAHARWRTLHEIDVVAQVLAEADDETISRYRAHAIIARSRFAEACDAAWPDSDGLAVAEVEAAHEERMVLREKFGRDFDQPLGWAAHLVKRPTLAKLEALSDLTRFRPLYSAASENIHAGAHGLDFSLGNPSDVGGVAHMPSDFGLQLPGREACGALCHVTMAFLSLRENWDFLIDQKVALDLAIKARESFDQVAARLETERRGDDEKDVTRDQAKGAEAV